MMTGPIRYVEKSREVHQTDNLLQSVWIGGANSSVMLEDNSWFGHHTQCTNTTVDRGAPVLVMLASETSLAFDELLAHGKAGERIYVLVPSDWGNGEIDDRLLACPKILIRRVPEVPVTGVHRVSGARLWLGDNVSGTAPWVLRLDTTQAEAYRQLFLRLFWHEATEEAWTTGQPLSFRVAGERPFDVPVISRTSPVRLLPPDTLLGEEEAKDALLHITTGPPPESAPKRLWFPTISEHYDLLSRLVHNGAKVAWEDRCLPDLFVGPQGSFALLPGSKARLRIELTSDQAADVAQILEKPGKWNFILNARLGDYVSDEELLWLPGESTARPIEREQQLDVSAVQAESFRSMFELNPESWPAPNPLALSVSYRWNVEPPRLPHGTVDDPRVNQWRKLDEEWSARLAIIRKALENTEGERGRIGKAFTRLVSSMLGFERTQKDIWSSLTEMEGILPSTVGPIEAGELLIRLAEIEEKTRKLQNDMEEAERRSIDEIARENQESEWMKRVGEAKRTLAIRHNDLTNTEGQLSNILQELSTINATPKSIDEKSSKDIKARRQKLSDEQVKFKSKVKSLHEEIESLQNISNEMFEFKPPIISSKRPASDKSRRFVPQTSTGGTSTIVPDEALPQVGYLRKKDSQRYLVIQVWEDLDVGEHEADRLNAKLVAEEES